MTEPGAASPRNPSATVQVCSGGPHDTYACDIDVGGHVLTADEPRAAGGKDAGPSPYDYLLVSLGACTAMTVRMYAERKGMALERVCVRLEHDRSHARDCAECETGDARVDHIRRELTLEGHLAPGERERLLQIAERCPVHRTLAGGIAIETHERQS